MLSAALVERFGGVVPRTLEEMVTLPGVGRKTANVVLGNAYGIPGITVDTHFGAAVTAVRVDDQRRPGEGRGRGRMFISSTKHPIRRGNACRQAAGDSPPSLKAVRHGVATMAASVDGRQAAARRVRPVPLRLEVLEDRRLLAAWVPQVSGTTQQLEGVWESGPNDVFAVGDGGLILHSANDGASLAESDLGDHARSFDGVWGSGPNEIFAVGFPGVIWNVQTTTAPAWQARIRGPRSSSTASGGAAPTTSSPSARAA